MESHVMAETRRPPRLRRETSPAALELLHRAQAGDRDAFGQLYAEHLDLVTRYVAVRLYGSDRDVIPDVVHDAFTEALAGLASAPPDVTGWLLQLAARACTNHSWATRRYLRATHEIQHRRVPTATTAPTPARRPGATVDSWMAVLAATAQLTDGQRTAIQLRYLDGYPRDRAAVVMGRSMQAVRELERRALRRLSATFSGLTTTATAVPR
jgi:RNA polymerase sigma-70 factor (ECF subfamily)